MKTNEEMDDEIAKIFAEAESSVTKQEKIGIDRENWRVKADFSTEDPDEAHRLYFRAINRLLNEFVYPILPKGPGRTQLNEAKNLLLNSGKRKNSKGIRGSSGQMSYNVTKQMVLDIIQDWIVTDGKSPFNLFTALREKNIELGYITRNERF